MSFDYAIMGKRISIRRKELGYSQLKLAEKLNISNNHLSSIETGKQRSSFEMFLQICDTLKINPDYLILGILSPSDIPKQITDNIRLCNADDVELLKDISELLIHRNKK